MSKLERAFIRTLLHADGEGQRLNDLGRRLGEWICSKDTGNSSIALCAVMIGAETDKWSAPSDAWDFGRCYRLLERIPEWRARIGEMATVSADWARLVAIWPELEAQFIAEGGSREKYAPLTAQMMYGARRVTPLPSPA